MKIDVLTVNDVDFGQFRLWSNWVDVAVFDYFGSGYLLQMKVSRWNRKRFHCVPLKSFFAEAHPCTSQAGHLTQGGVARWTPSR